MKATRIYYEKCINLGNYQNEKIGVEVELAENENAVQALDAAKKFVESNNNGSNAKLSRAKEVVENKDRYSYVQVVEAENLLKESQNNDDLPF